MSRPSADAASLAEGVRCGDRNALARAITLVESTREEDMSASRELLATVWPDTGGAIRVALTGVPGVGKSTLIDVLGLHLLSLGSSVAVLAVDPSSARGGGAILGDKTRMTRLTADTRAYVRPSPAAGASGGVALRTREAVCLCEAAGYDVVMVETVGIGQSEVTVSGMTDIFVLLVAPGAGDELQGVKRGVTELADFVLVNKCDGEFANAAQRTRAEYSAAIRLLRRRAGDPDDIPLVSTVSALTDSGVAECWERILSLVAWRRKNGHHEKRRRAQVHEWVRAAVVEDLLIRPDATGTGALPPEILDRLDSGAVDPGTAATEFLNKIRQP